MSLRIGTALAVCVVTLPAAAATQSERYQTLVADVLWSDEETARARAEGAARDDVSLADVSREQFAAFEGVLDRGRPDYLRPERGDGGFPIEAISVKLPDGRVMPAFVYLPPDYDPAEAWPMLLAMHGGPLGNPGQALQAAARMISVWLEPAREAGWIVVSPAMTHVVARAPRTEARLPYEILTAEQMESVLRAVQSRFHLDPDRLVSTGISLGSNFSIAYAAARPDRFAAIVPVSTEGESREPLLRNLQHVPVNVLEGARDRNIRDIRGPRALAEILDRFGYDVVYRELSDRAHEGFQEHYPETLRWLASRPRPTFPKRALRVPHRGIVPLARRVHWLEPDTRQGVLRASIEGQRIEIQARWAREVRLFLHDELVDLDRPIEVRVNGVRVFEGELARSIPFALAQVRELDDLARPYAASVAVAVPVSGSALESARELTEILEPLRPAGALSFWETYATRALEERFPSLGLTGQPVPDPAAFGLSGERSAIRIRAVDQAGPFGKSGIRVGDVLLEVGGEPFFDGRGLEDLRAWLLRELDGAPRSYSVSVLRDGERVELSVHLVLGGYATDPP